MLTQTTMRADAECGVHDFLSPGIKDARVFTNFRISGSRCKIERNTVPCPELFTGYRNICSNSSTYRNDGGIHAHRLLDHTIKLTGQCEHGVPKFRIASQFEYCTGHGMCRRCQTTKHHVQSRVNLVRPCTGLSVRIIDAGQDHAQEVILVVMRLFRPLAQQCFEKRIDSTERCCPAVRRTEGIALDLLEEIRQFFYGNDQQVLEQDQPWQPRRKIRDELTLSPRSKLTDQLAGITASL